MSIVSRHYTIGTDGYLEAERILVVPGKDCVTGDSRGFVSDLRDREDSNGLVKQLSTK